MSDKPTIKDEEIFHVSGSMAFFSWLICDHPGLWKSIGKVETSVLADTLDKINIDKPVYVSGLARSGSTILLEILNEVPGMVSQRYKDFPPVFTPYAWHKLLGHMTSGEAKPAERAHKDGILVTQDSPEAMEEPIWMSFFPQAHNPQHNNALMPGCEDQGFADFYRAHIRKLLAVHNGQRYLAKANYQISRLEYLLDLFPDARFVLPVRAAETHIASLMKQHDLFKRGQSANARARQHLRRVGHYEFGLDRTPINTGNQAVTDEVIALWERGEEIQGWAVYWNDLYAYLAGRIEANPKLAAASQIVVFEELCADPTDILGKLIDHCDLGTDADFLNKAAARISAPTYYKSKFSTEELSTIRSVTDATYNRIRGLVG